MRPLSHVLPNSNNGFPSSSHTHRHVSDQNLLSAEEADAIIQRVRDLSRGGGKSNIFVGVIAKRTIRWARNRVMMAGDRFLRLITVERRVADGAPGSAGTNQFDSTSIEHLVRVAEERSRIATGERMHRGEPYVVQPPDFPVPRIPIWSDATATVDAETQARLAATLTEEADSRDLLSAGYLEAKRAAFAVSDILYGTRYGQFTDAQCSATVRHPSGNGAGWAGASWYDWSRIDHVELAGTALRKCVASVDPVRIEPGRYTVVLEPQAVYDLVRILVSAFNRLTAEKGEGPFALSHDRDAGLNTTKLGLQVVDPRITIDHDPNEPGLGMLPERGLGPVTWIRNGVLETLGVGLDISQNRRYALSTLTENITAIERRTFRMSGGTATIDDMIATTKGGLLVTRFSNVFTIDRRSLLTTGVTRDGMWLIENGKIAKAVKNLRFVESPLFVLNQVDTLGKPQSVFAPIPIPGETFGDELFEFEFGPVSGVVPSMKALDFNFAATVDAI